VNGLRDTLAGVGLTKTEEDAVVLVHEQGLSQEEAGARLGLKEQTVREYLKRGHRKMRKHFVDRRLMERRFADLKAGLEANRDPSEKPV
jgi:DNA-directed RNA polymerase specialized sigma24 family protein